MKKIVLSSILGVAVIMGSCGKKVTASFSGATQGQAYHTHHKTSTVQNSEANIENAASATTIATNEAVVANEVVEAKESKEVAVSKAEKSKKTVAALREDIKNLDQSKLTEKQQKLVKKLDKKLEKLEKKQKNAKDLMHIGIVLAIAGLAGILIGAILGIGILWQLGALCLVIGFCLIVYDLIAD